MASNADTLFLQTEMCTRFQETIESRQKLLSVTCGDQKKSFVYAKETETEEDEMSILKA